jgi:hypothetical protein
MSRREIPSGIKTRWIHEASAVSIIDELRRFGAVLLRRKNHQVWRLPNGRRFVVSQTASDHRALRNQMATLRRTLEQK